MDGIDMDSLKIVLANPGDALPVQNLLSEAGLPHEDVAKYLWHFLLRSTVCWSEWSGLPYSIPSLCDA